MGEDNPASLPYPLCASRQPHLLRLSCNHCRYLVQVPKFMEKKCSFSSSTTLPFAGTFLCGFFHDFQICNFHRCFHIFPCRVSVDSCTSFDSSPGNWSGYAYQDLLKDG